MDKMKEKPLIAPIKISNRKVLIYLIILFAIGVPILNNISENQWNNMLNTYHLVDTKSEFEGIVYNIELQKFTCVNLNNKIYIRFNSMDNYSYKPFNFSSFLQVGDSIYKKEESDTVYIIRNDAKYYFLINSLSRN